MLLKDLAEDIRIKDEFTKFISLEHIRTLGIKVLSDDITLLNLILSHYLTIWSKINIESNKIIFTNAVIENTSENILKTIAIGIFTSLKCPF